MAFYLFPGHTYNRIKEAYQKNFLLSYDDDSHTIDAIKEDDSGLFIIEKFYEVRLGQCLQASYQLYQLYSRQYWGFGALLQFLPGTNAKRAREQLIQDLEPEVNKLDGEGLRMIMPRFENSFLNFLSYSFDHLIHDFIINISNISYPDIRPLNSIFLITMPLLKDIFIVDRKYNILIQSDAVRNILHSLLNPFRLIKDTLNFLRKGINLLLEFGAKSNEYDELSTLQVSLKSVVWVIFGIIALPIKVAEYLIDIPLFIINSLIINPIIHIGKSIYESFENRNKNTVLLSIYELDVINELKKKAKETNAIHYPKIPNPSNTKKEFIGSLPGIYEYQEIQHRLIAIRASSDKVDKITSLMEKMTFFRNGDKTLENQKMLVEEAREILFHDRGLGQ